MEKKILSLVLVLVFAFSISAYSAGPIRAPRVTASLSFSGKTATCSGSVYADNRNDTVSVTVTLWSGNVCKGTWTKQGNYSARTSGTKAVTSGVTYTVKVNTTINGVTQPTKSVTRTCP